MTEQTTTKLPAEDRAANEANPQVRARIRKLKLQGLLPEEIADELQKELELVNQVLQQVQQQREQRPALPIRACVEQLVEDVDLIRREAWQAWLRSQKDHRKLTEKTISGGSGGDRTELTDVWDGQVGDATFLRLMMECNRRELQVRTMEMPKRSSAQGGAVPVDFEAMVEQVEAAIAAEELSREST